MATSRPGVYAGGDAVTGAATVILAMGRQEGRRVHAPVPSGEAQQVNTDRLKRAAPMGWPS